MRIFLKQNKQVRIEKTLNQPSAEHITNLVRDTSLMVDPVIDEKVQKFLTALFKKDGDISNGISSATEMFYSAEGKICPLKILKQHQCGEEASSNDLYFVSASSNSLPKIKFPAKFSTPVNEKHYSNTEKLSNIYRKLLYHTFMMRE